jgi:HIRAN domain
MGLFQRSRNGHTRAYRQPDRPPLDERPAWMVDGASAVLVEGREDLEVVGESRYQDNLWRLVGRRYDPGERVREETTAVLVAEPDNPHDANAISIWIDGLKVGYLSREDAQRHHAGLLALQDKHRMPVALSGVIAGGGLRDDGPGRLGVFLRYDPAEFGLSHPPSSFPSGSMRTGMSDALATDEADETYDLAWMRDLPADDIRAIPKLRRLLTDEHDPLSRHFMYVQLEKMLYRSRNVFSSALDEYDEVCVRHDAEMNAIRAACMDKWNHVPALETYRQMAIRQQKAKNFASALLWTERGLALYGDDCPRQEAVEDLYHRAANYSSKLLSTPSRSEPAGVDPNGSTEDSWGNNRPWPPGRHARPEGTTT